MSAPVTDEDREKARKLICAACLIQGKGGCEPILGVCDQAADGVAQALIAEREKWWKLGQWQGWESSAALVEDEREHSHESHDKGMFAAIVTDHIRIDQNVVPIEKRTINDRGGLIEPPSAEGKSCAGS